VHEKGNSGEVAPIGAREVGKGAAGWLTGGAWHGNGTTRAVSGGRGASADLDLKESRPATAK